MPLAVFEDHVIVDPIDAHRSEIRGKTWIGRDFIRVLHDETSLRCFDYDDDPTILATGGERDVVHGAWAFIGYVETRTTTYKE